jgi:hypothetical protein
MEKPHRSAEPLLGSTELGGIRGLTGQLQIDRVADVHQSSGAEIRATGSINELLKLLRTDVLPDFPDAVSRALGADGVEAMVVVTSLQVGLNRLIPAATRSAERLRRLPPLLRLAQAEFVMNQEKL